MNQRLVRSSDFTIWKPDALSSALTVSIPIAYKVRCAGWVTRSGQIEAWFVQGFPRFDRHTSGLEDVIDFFTGITDEFNRKIQRTLNEMAGAGRQAVDLVLLPEKRSCSSIAARAGAAWEDDAIVYDFGRLTPPPTTLPGKN